ncbi:uncharacterized protein [Watersipora subatra]|uniref:uncharacterized protein n=1 Tax=Watersipora subatra TaxID=2589382 RepID=UPI00355B2A16
MENSTLKNVSPNDFDVAVTYVSETVTSTNYLIIIVVAVLLVVIVALAVVICVIVWYFKNRQRPTPSNITSHLNQARIEVPQTSITTERENIPISTRAAGSTSGIEEHRAGPTQFLAQANTPVQEPSTSQVAADSPPMPITGGDIESLSSTADTKSQ